KLLICMPCGGGSTPCIAVNESVVPLKEKAGVGDVTSNCTGIVIELFCPLVEVIVTEPLLLLPLADTVTATTHALPAFETEALSQLPPEVEALMTPIPADPP